MIKPDMLLVRNIKNLFPVLTLIDQFILSVKMIDGNQSIFNEKKRTFEFFSFFFFLKNSIIKKRDSILIDSSACAFCLQSSSSNGNERNERTTNIDDNECVTDRDGRKAFNPFHLQNSSFFLATCL
jgi:hypothetical protein